MEISIEMKMQELDKMLEMREQLAVMQDNLGVYNSFDKKSNILIYSTKEFIFIARCLNASVGVRNVGEKNKHLIFSYRGTKFVTYILPCEYEEYKGEIVAGGGENA